MDPKRSVEPKSGEEENGSSHDALDTSSASSLSFFAENSDGNSRPGEQKQLLHTTDGQRSGECSPRQPMDEALKSEKAFIEFVMSLPPKKETSSDHRHHHRSSDSVGTSPKGTAGGSTTKVGLDHLDNLCKLMEQLSELRDTNNKLQRRVQYLEDLKTLHDMHKEISDENQYSTGDTSFNNSKPRTAAYELQKSATETCCPKVSEDASPRAPSRPHKYQASSRRARTADGQRRERSKSVGHEENGEEDPKSRRIFPKWSKVKEAFGWESDRKDSVKMVKGECGHLQVPRRCSDDSHHSFHPPKSPTWSQDYPSLHSSLEDVHDILDSGRWKRCSVASEKSVLRVETPKEALRRQKSTPSPGSEKILPHREMQDLKPKSSTIERDTYSHLEYSKFEKEEGKRGKSPWGRVKTIIERRRDSLKRRSLRNNAPCPDCESSLKKCAEECKGCECSDRQQLSSSSDSKQRQHYVPEAIVIDEETDYGGGPRTPSSSPTFHRKSRWTRVKKVLKGKKEDDGNPSLSTPASPNSGQDGHFTFEPVEEPTQDECEDGGREMKRVGSDSQMHQLALSAPTCDLMLQLQRNLSEDFHRKIMEWERIRSSAGAPSSPHHWDRKPSLTTTRSRKKSERDDSNKTAAATALKPKLKDLTWLEKELQKIEKEKQRLSKERQKYEERALRLERLKETVLRANSSNKREVFVRTSAGEFRFEGISDAFTKKLYEWETKRGLGPELSTIALLDSSRLMVHPSSLGPKSGTLQRVVSRSESSLADIGQPSHNSSNSLPSLKMPEPVDAERANQPSRANSEPDLSTLVALANGSNVSVSNLSRQADDSLEDVLTSPRGSEGDDPEKGVSRNDSETYYNLLEENVILLEQLKDKEEICSRLENELQVLDKKVDLMDKHHTQETELYREKLWEMHKPGATPRDVQCCLRTMAQLRKRIEVLEKCTEKLRNDRESIEDSFRYHSKQQEDMTLDLLQKMSELQAAGSNNTDCESKESVPHRMDVSAVERLQDLSALLVKQTQELQETLSAKSRQICQLRWELLHRDLSTVKLETELHTHTAHRKRSKYAHYRSHSSEEASASALPQELECGKSTILTEAYYKATSPDTEFRATELTNTVQQLKKEVLRLANSTTANECPHVDYETPESSPIRTSKEKSWSKIGSKLRDKAKAITVRRSSADNLSTVSGKEVRRSNAASCSSDSDDSTDDGYTKINLRAGCKNYFSNQNAERLLMSSGEYPPRGYLQRKKKLQKMSSPNRRRSNTFHIKREYEKPTVCDNTPQKCYSFRYPTEKVPNCTAVKYAPNTINVRNLLGEVKYQEFLKKKAQMFLNNNSQTVAKNQNSQLVPNDIPGNQILREVASDSKIPFLFQVQYRTENFLRDKLSNKYPVRSMSDKQRKETAVERRENFHNRKSKRHVTSPDLFSTLSENTKARLLAINSHQHQIASKSEPGQESATKVKPAIKFQSSERVSPPRSNIPVSNADSSTVTVHLPKRKLKKAHHLRMPDNSSENIEETVTIVIPKKRSLSSEQEFESSVNLSFPSRETSQQSSRLELSEQNSCTDYSLQNNRDSMENHRSETTITTSLATDGLQDESKSRKRKAEDGDSSSQDVSDNQETVQQQNSSSFASNQTHPNDAGEKQERFQRGSTGYVKSPSAPHLNWRNVCAKKISREGAPNVRLLIEKYNKVAESQSTRSPNASNFSSPSSSRKTSAPPLTGSQSDRSIASYSFSTPTTPSITSFYNPPTFRPANLDLFPSSPPSSPRTEALKRAREDFISSRQNNKPVVSDNNKHSPRNQSTSSLSKRSGGQTSPEDYSPTSLTLPANITGLKRTDDDGVSHCSMDSASLVMFRTGETCKESRLSKRSAESRPEPEALGRTHNLKTSKSLSNSSIFKSVLSSDFKIPSTFLRLNRGKQRKKDMDTVSHLCRQSLLLTMEDTPKIPAATSHKSCPSSPELKSKNEVKPNWFHRNILRQK